VNNDEDSVEERADGTCTHDWKLKVRKLLNQASIQTSKALFRDIALLRDMNAAQYIERNDTREAFNGFNTGNDIRSMLLYMPSILERTSSTKPSSCILSCHSTLLQLAERI
jgi:hypothetical protein